MPTLLGSRVPAAVAGGSVVAAALLITLTSYQTWSAALIGATLVAVSMLALTALTRNEADPRIRRVILLAAALKIAAGYARYAVNALLYDGGGDSNRYSETGALLAQAWLRGDWIGSGRPFPGTGFVDGLTAAIYTVTGPSFVGGFLVFAWIGFWGLYLTYRALVLAVPDADHWRYALLVLLLPSLLFWPSAIGKDAWMVLGIGLFSYGTARLLAGLRGGLPLLALGGFGAGLVRPHITLILVLALTVALLLRRPSIGGGGGVGQALLLAVVLAAGFVALRQVDAFFNLDDTQNLSDAIDYTAQQTNSGGSSFDGASVRNPLTIPFGIVTVLFRPFPYEATNLQALATSLEGVLLLVLFARALPTLRTLPARLAATPYVAFALTYVLLFCLAFSSFSNFGLLTRQRVQVFPLFLVLLVLPLVGSRAPGRSRAVVLEH